MKIKTFNYKSSNESTEDLDTAINNFLDNLEDTYNTYTIETNNGLVHIIYRKLDADEI